MATADALIVFRVALRGGRRPTRPGVKPEFPSMFNELRRSRPDEPVLDPEPEVGTSGANDRLDVLITGLRASRGRYAVEAMVERLAAGIVGAQRVQSLA